MAGFEWHENERKTSAQTYVFEGVIEAYQLSPLHTRISTFQDLEYDTPPYFAYNVRGDLDTAKKLVENAITATRLENAEENKDMAHFENPLYLQIKEHEQTQNAVQNLKRATNILATGESQSKETAPDNNKEIIMADATKEKEWVKHEYPDDMCETLSYTYADNEKIFFTIHFGSFEDSDIGISCFPRDPQKMDMQDWPRADHPLYADIESLKKIVGETVEHFDKMKKNGQGFEFADITNHLGHKVSEVKEERRNKEKERKPTPQPDNEKMSLIGILKNRFKSKQDDFVKTEERYWEDNSLVVKRFHDDGTTSTVKTPTKEKTAEAKNDFKKLAVIMATGRSENVYNKGLGFDISIEKGHTGKDGYGLLHIIEGRHTKDKLDKNETTALLYKVNDAAKNGFLTNSIAIRQKDSDERIGIEKDGIIAIAGRRKGTHENFVITGYEINDKKEEAAEAIKTVIANYGRTPEFSDFRKQVGAAVSSLQQVSPQPDNKSSEIEAAKKAGYVQGVCECVAAIGSDYALGKKLLAEMSVSKKLAEKYAKPETFKALEEGIYAQKQEQKLEHSHRRKR